MSEVSLSEIVEIIDVPSVEGGVRLLNYLERPWVIVGVALVGFLIGGLVLVKGNAYGLLWVYIAGIFLLDYVFKPSESRKQVTSVLALSTLTGIAFLLLREWGGLPCLFFFMVCFSLLW
ncbi:hypothetical protein [Thermococcus sp. JCM 11816]|uniref:hypothetical protein n=1 Tax=Thermococcus sp. (strain JCM 11816 / KS-1) TaxID=1295125 RepID=UPI0034669903